MSAPIERTNDYGQAGQTYRSFEDWERDELIKNLSDALAVCDKRIQDAMIEHFTKADEDYGRRVKKGIEKKMKELAKQEREKSRCRDVKPDAPNLAKGRFPPTRQPKKPCRKAMKRILTDGFGKMEIRGTY